MCRSMNETHFNIRPTIILVGLSMLAIIFCYEVLNPIHKKNIEQLSEPPLIVCSSCKGKGEKPTDINKLMMDTSLALFIKHHLDVDKCKKCVKLPYGDSYDYCDTVQNKYQILVQKYATAGPKIDMSSCEKCMGTGIFSSKAESHCRE